MEVVIAAVFTCILHCNLLQATANGLLQATTYVGGDGYKRIGRVSSIASVYVPHELANVH